MLTWVVNLSKLKKNSFFKNPNDCVMYIFDKNESFQQFDYINKLLPSFEEIIEYHHSDFIKNNSNNNLIKDVIGEYGFKYNELDISNINLIRKYNESFITKKISILEKINILENKIINNTFLDKMNHKINIEDHLIEEIQKMTGLKYIQFKNHTDNDTLRFNWIKANKNTILFMFYNEILL